MSQTATTPFKPDAAQEMAIINFGIAVLSQSHSEPRPKSCAWFTRNLVNIQTWHRSKVSGYVGQWKPRTAHYPATPKRIATIKAWKAAQPTFQPRPVRTERSAQKEMA